MSAFYTAHEYESAIESLVGTDGPEAGCERALAADGSPRAVRLLARLPVDIRRRMAEACVEMYKAADSDERRSRLLTLHAGLLANRVDLLETDGLEARVLATMRVENSAQADAREVVLKAAAESDDFPWTAERLRTFSTEHRNRLIMAVDWMLGLGRVDDPEQRARLQDLHAALSSGHLEHLGFDALKPMLLAAVARGDIEEAAESVLADKDFAETVDQVRTLPENVRGALMDACADLYAPHAPEYRRIRVVRMHAALSLSLDRPDDRLAAAREEALRFDPDDLVRTVEMIETAWAQLASGRDIPDAIGARMRHEYFSPRPFKAKELRKVVRLLADRGPVLNPGHVWTDRALAELADLPGVWTEAVRHAATATKPRPDAAWEESGRALLSRIDGEEFAERVLGWLPLVSDPHTYFAPDSYNANAARGLVWLLALLPTRAETVRGVGTVLEEALRTPPSGSSPGIPKLANACAHALCMMKGDDATAELSRLTAQMAYKPALKILQAELNARS
ncbi:hypothetical protein O4J56_00115 [Nocardiopsis sp. RSe5-2]|uniref:Uncharacterized protein n=1 Tax=Nocardiopsis endophytica TaxID=3018445 RepID=A0ABT4TWF6_9ACTN|nr:hypothetical protein [Nocardiopsis endophytica]MDA2809033.1 hypothetical protein [Nocardiopsis endophytica]